MEGCMQMERDISLVRSNALLNQLQIPALPCSWEQHIDGEPTLQEMGGGTAFPVEVPRTKHTSPLAHLCHLHLLQCKCLQSCPHFAMWCLEDVDVEREFEGGWRWGQVLVHWMEIFWTSQPPTLLQVITPFFSCSPDLSGGSCSALPWPWRWHAVSEQPGRARASTLLPCWANLTQITQEISAKI